MWAIGNKSRERASHIEKDIFWPSAISPPDRVISLTAGYVSSGRIFIKKKNEKKKIDMRVCAKHVVTQQEKEKMK
jgi:hypothetical protein